MIDFFKKKKIMIVAAHPDDEILGLGASIHRLIQRYSVQVHVVILGEGLTSRDDKRNPEKWKKQLEVHQKNIKDAQDKIGFESVNTYSFPDNRFDSVPLLDIIKTVEKEKTAWKPDIIFTHHSGDVNIDHQKTFEAVTTACRPIEDECVRAILTFETPSSTEWIPSSEPRHFLPNLFIEIEENNLQAKIDAMESYEFERRNYPHPRSPKALRTRASFWGQTVGATYAEAFQVIRMIG